jgi:hypothetical protein
MNYNYYFIIPMSEQFAYLAGIVDGEGCLSIRRVVRGKTIYHVAMLEVGMCERPVIELFSSVFGGSVWYECPRGMNKNIHKWRVTGTNVLPVLQAIYPWLIAKNTQAQILFDFFPLIGVKGQRLTKDNINERERLCKLIKKAKG